MRAFPEVVKIYQAKINNIIFHHIPRLSFYFVDIPVKIFQNLLGIGFEFYFLSFFLSNNSIGDEIKYLAFWFNLVIILFFLFYTFLLIEIQKKKNWEKAQQSKIEKQRIQIILNSLT